MTISPLARAREFTATAAVSTIVGLTLACGSNGTAAGASSPPARHASVPLAATCTMGYIDLFGPNGVQIGSDNPGASYAPPLFYPGRPPAADPLHPAAAYMLTAHNDTSGTITVAGFAVVFYTASGSEAGFDDQAGEAIITAGQRWTWFRSAPWSLDGQWDNQTSVSRGDVPGDATTCRLVRWDRP